MTTDAFFAPDRALSPEPSNSDDDDLFVLPAASKKQAKAKKRKQTSAVPICLPVLSDQNFERFSNDIQQLSLDQCESARNTINLRIRSLRTKIQRFKKREEKKRKAEEREEKRAKEKEEKRVKEQEEKKAKEEKQKRKVRTIVLDSESEEEQPDKKSKTENEKSPKKIIHIPLEDIDEVRLVRSPPRRDEQDIVDGLTNLVDDLIAQLRPPALALDPKADKVQPPAPALDPKAVKVDPRAPPAPALNPKADKLQPPAHAVDPKADKVDKLQHSADMDPVQPSDREPQQWISIHEFLRSRTHKPVVVDVDCGCCYLSVPVKEVISCSVGHVNCRRCVMTEIQAALKNSKAVIRCTEVLPGGDRCDKLLNHADLRRYDVFDDLLNKVIRNKEISEIQSAMSCNLRVCPNSKCQFQFTVDSEYKESEFECVQCHTIMCLHCADFFHVGPCYQELLKDLGVVQCPKCKQGAMHNKDGSCNKMTCNTKDCGGMWCALCGKDLDGVGYRHFCKEYEFSGEGTHNPCVGFGHRHCHLWGVKVVKTP